jgi:hypothetical protein
MAAVSRAFISLDISIVHAVRMTVLNLLLFDVDLGGQNDARIISFSNAAFQPNRRY